MGRNIEDGCNAPGPKRPGAVPPFVRYAGEAAMTAEDAERYFKS